MLSPARHRRCVFFPLIFSLVRCEEMVVREKLIHESGGFFSTLFLAPAITKVEKKCDLEEHFLACRVSWTCFPIDQPDDDGGDGPSGSYGDN